MVYDQQRTVYTVIIALAVIVLVVISVMAYQSVTVSQPKIETDETIGVDYAPNRAVKVSFTLPAISIGQYALWALTDQNEYWLIQQFRVDTGGFIIGLNGEPISAVFVIPERDLTVVTAFVVTLEEGDKVVAAPSQTVVLATQEQQRGNFTLTFPHDLSAVTGTFQLATPTNGLGSNETSGVWFTQGPNTTETATLNIPKAPDGWVYQGWAVYQGVKLNIGRFTQAAGKDDFSNYSGPRSFPDFPGEDFLTNAPTAGNLTFPLDLADGNGAVLITLEPATSDNATDPTGEDLYPLTMLRTDISKGAEPLVQINLANVFSGPAGTVQILTK